MRSNNAESTVAETATAQYVRSRSSEMPLFQNGDHLTQQEFHSRYRKMPGVSAELIDGKVVMASPVFDNHATYHGLMMSWAGCYSLKVPWLKAVDNASFILTEADEVQPDVALLSLTEKALSSVNESGCRVGIAEMVIEVAYSSASYDLFEKYELYQQAGAVEYIVVDIQSERVHWFRRQGNRLEEQSSEDGVYRSSQFPGLWLSVASIFPVDGERLLATLNAGMASPEFEAYLAT